MSHSAETASTENCVGGERRWDDDLERHVYNCRRKIIAACYVCQRPVCGIHAPISKVLWRGYQVRACPDCRKKYPSTAPEMSPPPRWSEFDPTENDE